MTPSRRAIQAACYGGGALCLAGALWLEGGAVWGFWKESAEPAPLPPPPRFLSDLPRGRSAAQYEPIHKLLGPPPAVRAEAVERLPFQIAGGFMEMGPGVRFVNIRNSAGKERVYQAGDLIEKDDAKILQIDVAAETVLVHWRNREWILQWKRGGTPPPPVGVPRPPASGDAPPESSGVYEISGEQFQDYHDNFLSKYYPQGTYRMMPDGGLQIRDLQEGAEIRKYGFRVGDVVKKVNGEPISLSNVSELFNAAASADEHVIAGERDGKPFEVRIKVNR